jgi:hypothetical protein
MNKSLEAEGHIPGELVFGVDDQNPKAGCRTAAWASASPTAGARRPTSRPS